jgi:tight adherence protein C
MDELASYIAPILAVGVFAVTLMIAYAVRMLLNPERTARDRVADLTGGRDTPDDGLVASSAPVRGMTSNLSALAAPSDEDEANEARRRLSQAGFRSRTNLEVFSAVRATLALSVPLVLWAMLPAMQLEYLLFFLLLAATVGYYLPIFWVSHKVEKRQEALMKPFPDALDLLVSSVEAGLGLDAAFRRVAEEMESAAPELARELQAVNHEVAAGIPRVEALRHLDHRTGLDEVNSLVNVLMQAERFGTSVARALRVHSDLVRKKRMLAAEEHAAQISPKLTVAMILFILPSLFVVLAGPAVINVIQTLMPAMAGQ